MAGVKITSSPPKSLMEDKSLGIIMCLYPCAWPQSIASRNDSRELPSAVDCSDDTMTIKTLKVTRTCKLKTKYKTNLLTI